MTKISELEVKAQKIRSHVVKMIYEAGSGHPGGSLSCVEILVGLYFYAMRHDPKNPTWEDRDYFVLSKGHAAPTFYAVLAEAGYFPLTELSSLRKMGSRLQGHPDKLKLPGVEVSSGSLGQGISVANGIALAERLDNRDNFVYVLVGDGECDEGQIWESAMLSSHYNLDNVIAIVDRNGLQIDGPTEKVLCIESIAEKWHAFGWNVIEIDGNQMEEVIGALDQAKRFKGKPTVIIAHTFKGKGVSFMEWIAAFHGRALNKEEMLIALKELSV